jgi:transposase
MESITLQYRAYVPPAGCRRIDDVLLLMGHLQNALIQHRYCASSSHRKLWSLKLQNQHLTDLHRHLPEYNTCARRILEATAQRVNKSFAAFFKAPQNVGRPETKSPYRNRTIEISEPSILHLKPAKPGWAMIHIKGLPTIRFRTDHRLPADTQPKIIRITKKAKRLDISLVFEHEPQQLQAPARASVGIDPGRKRLITAKSNDGSILHIPGINDAEHLQAKKRLLRRMQRQRDAALRDGRARFISQKTGSGHVKRRFRWPDAATTRRRPP